VLERIDKNIESVSIANEPSVYSISQKGDVMGDT